MTKTDADLDDFYAAWEQAWQKIDVEGMKSLWDKDFGDLVYQAEEGPEPLLTWQAIAEYWEAGPTVVEAVDEWRCLDRHTTVLGDVALIFTRLSVNVRLVDVPKPLTGEIRCSLVVHETPSGWRLIHYHESRAVDLAHLLT